MAWATECRGEMCCHMAGVRRQGGRAKNEDVQCSTFGWGGIAGIPIPPSPVRPKQELGSVQFPEICGMDNGLGHRMGKRKQSPFQ